VALVILDIPTDCFLPGHFPPRLVPQTLPNGQIPLRCQLSVTTQELLVSLILTCTHFRNHSQKHSLLVQLILRSLSFLTAALKLIQTAYNLNLNILNTTMHSTIKLMKKLHMRSVERGICPIVHSHVIVNELF